MSDDKRKLLKERGWYPWYNDDYWCHEQFSTNGTDPTYRGLSLNDAYRFETDETFRRGIVRAADTMDALCKIWNTTPHKAFSK